MELIGKSVLVVDDEPSVLTSVSMMLESRGCEVHQSNSGMDALEKIPAIVDSLDCIILDYTMPKLNGMQVLTKIRESNIATPVIICSGLLLDQPTGPDAVLPDFILSKPFRLQDLTNKIIELSHPSN